MGRPCTICIHPHRAEIDEKILQGEARLRIAREFEVNRRAIDRHELKHIGAAMKQAAAMAACTDALTGIEQLKRTRRELAALMDEARASGDPRMRMYLIDRCLKQIALEVKLFGNEPADIDLAHHPQWLAVRRVLCTQLAPHPELWQSLADALDAVQA